MAVNLENSIVLSGISAHFSNYANTNDFWSKLMKPNVKSDKEHNNSTKRGEIIEDTATENKNINNPGNISCAGGNDVFSQLLNATAEAIMDSGTQPAMLKGMNIGVFINETSTSPKTGSAANQNGQGSISSKLASNFHFHGPTYSWLNETCSLLPLHQAISVLNDENCKGAIVGTFQMIPGQTVPTELIVMFLQKFKFARRCYFSINGSHLNEIRSTSSMPEELANLLNDAYKPKPNCDLPTLLEMSNSPISGIPEDSDNFSDELQAILKTFGETRKMDAKNSRILVSAPDTTNFCCNFNGFRSILKLVLSLHYKIFPGNPAVGRFQEVLSKEATNRKLQILNEHASIKYQSNNNENIICGLNSIGKESIVHLILNYSEGASSSKSNANMNLPALIPFSGPNKELVQTALEKICVQNRNIEFDTLLRDLADNGNPDCTDWRQIGRGYLLKSNDESFTPVISVQETSSSEKRPLWFVFSGMGTIWPGMISNLMNFDQFASSIKKSSEIMKPYIDLLEILVNGDDKALDRYMGVCFIAFGIALTDLLIALELQPDGYIGHSGGELFCAYLDGCISQEEALLSYYWKDELVLLCSDGAMASIPMSLEAATKKCPPWIYPVCHNSKNNVTIGGMAADVTKFLTKLKLEENISSTPVNTSGVAYHTRYLKPMWPEYETRTKSIVTNMKPRSDKWLSTSIPQKDWATKPYTGMADYLLYNMRNPVLFYPVVKNIPKDAIVLEISANSFLTYSIEKSLPKTCSILGLIRKDYNGNKNSSSNNAEQFLNSIGKLYMYGVNPKINNIYPKVEYPVKRSKLPLISELVRL